ncbi:orotate phosphoribosyltransferase [Zavarzinia sp. CC-PAN008]|uniref:orotate phosphoribosyltransferase n=1 Tax=Zavarzinia sp. CC-PAN008 TaxID=3243332 RepID=UPI003F746F7F
MTDAPSRLAQARAQVFATILDNSFGWRDLILASGRPSDFYIDMKPTMLDPVAAAALPHLILDRIAPLQVDAVGGLEMGAVPLITPVIAQSLDSRPLTGFFVRKKAKDHGTKKLVEGPSIDGRRVVIIEDVTTTGGSAMQAVEAVRASGGIVALVLSVVDREEGAAEFYAEQGIPFDALFRASEFKRARPKPAA